MAPALSLLLIATLSAVASAQQTGIFYWCALSEGGSNFVASSASNEPRTYWGASQLGYQSQACHMSTGSPPYSTLVCTNQAYMFSNGTSYPLNSCTSGASVYAIAPSACQVQLTYFCISLELHEGLMQNMTFLKS
jgi:hypothetical protein